MLSVKLTLALTSCNFIDNYVSFSLMFYKHMSVKMTNVLGGGSGMKEFHLNLLLNFCYGFLSGTRTH